MKIHNNAIEYLNNILKSDTTGRKYLRFIKDGCSWHARYKIVLDERKKDDILYVDKGFRIIVSPNISHFLTGAIIQCKQTINGCKILIR